MRRSVSGVRCDRATLKRRRSRRRWRRQPPTGEGTGSLSLSRPSRCPPARYIRRNYGERREGGHEEDFLVYVTYFNTDDKGRSANIALAASQETTASTVRPKEEFSFNRDGRPPARKANGFREAKVIQDGEFIVGYGAAVYVRSSTTLYNAAVLAGLKITARHPHSLAVALRAAFPRRDGVLPTPIFDSETNMPIPSICP